jgi:hypothetical protein
MNRVITILKKKLDTANSEVSLHEKGLSKTSYTKINKVKSFIIELQQAIEILERSETKSNT